MKISRDGMAVALLAGCLAARLQLCPMILFLVAEQRALELLLLLCLWHSFPVSGTNYSIIIHQQSPLSSCSSSRGSCRQFLGTLILYSKTSLIPFSHEREREYSLDSMDVKERRNKNLLKI